MTKIFDLVYPNGMMVAVDKEAKIHRNDWFLPLNCHLTHQRWKDTPMQFCDAKDYGRTLMTQTGHGFPKDGCIKIVAIQDPKLNLPLLPDIETNAEKSAILASEKRWPIGIGEEFKTISENPYNALRLGFVEGYKAASAKKYTEEDMWEAAKFGYDENFRNTTSDGTETHIAKADFDIWLQKLNPRPIQVELEMGFAHVSEKEISDSLMSKLQGKGETLVPRMVPIIVNGFVKVKKWI